MLNGYVVEEEGNEKVLIKEHAWKSQRRSRSKLTYCGKGVDIMESELEK